MAPKPPPTPDEPPPDGFAVIPGDSDRLVALRDVTVEFYPRGCKTPSEALLFNKGAVVTRAVYEQRVDTYRRYSRMEVK